MGAWIAAYERVWRTPGVEAVGEIFTENARYSQGPYQEPRIGLAAIGDMWEAQRNGSDEAFEMTSEVVAIEGDTAVARIEVRYGEPDPQEWRDLWVMSFAPDGRCASFEEWPFSP